MKTNALIGFVCLTCCILLSHQFSFKSACQKAHADSFQTTALAQSSWPCIGHDSSRTCQSPYIGAQSSKLKWTSHVSETYLSSPIIDANNTIYFASGDGNLYAIRSDGRMEWFFKTDDVVPTVPAIGLNGTIYCGSTGGTAGSGRLYAIDPGGHLKWLFQTGGYGITSPAIAADGTIYIGIYFKGSCGYDLNAEQNSAGDDNLYALDPNGLLKWSYKTGSMIPYSPAIGNDGTIYFKCDDKNIYALDPNGRLKWKSQMELMQGSSLATSPDGTIYNVYFETSMGGDATFTAIDPNGLIKWEIQCGGEMLTYISDISLMPAISADGTIYFGLITKYILPIYGNKPSCSYSSRIYSIDLNGSLIWDNTIETISYWDYLISPPPLEHFFISIPPWEAISTWYSSYYAHSFSPSSLAIGADGTIYTVSYGGNIYTYNSDGSLKWQYSTDDRFLSSPAIGSDGTIYIGSENGNIYAFGEEKSYRAYPQWPACSLWPFLYWSPSHINQPWQNSWGTIFDQLPYMKAILSNQFINMSEKDDSSPYQSCWATCLDCEPSFNWQTQNYPLEIPLDYWSW
ncbi:MAG: PQQ-binding-like beta-propeller repeat protein [bacterium]